MLATYRRLRMPRSSRQRLLHSAPHHPVEVALDPLVVNRDDIVQRTRCIVWIWRLPLAGLVAFSHLQFSQIWGRQLYLERIPLTLKRSLHGGKS